MARIAMIGATGLIGRSLAPLLVAAGHEVTILGRRPSGIDGATECIGPIEEWSEELAEWRGDVGISTLGTTWKKSGSWAAFRAIDHEAVVAFARAVRGGGARQFLTVSSVGADPSSKNDYLALKGGVERDLAGLAFDRLDIFRPGLLRGERGQDRRIAERLGILVSPIVNMALRGPCDRYQAIDATKVAAAMARIAGIAERGVVRHDNRAIKALA